MEGETSLEAFREVTMTGGGEPVSLCKVLLLCGTIGVTIWGRYQCADKRNVKKPWGRTSGIPAENYGEEDVKFGGWFLVEGGGRKFALGGGDTTSQNLHWQDAGNSVRVSISPIA